MGSYSVGNITRKMLLLQSRRTEGETNYIVKTGKVIFRTKPASTLDIWNKPLADGQMVRVADHV